MLNKYWYLGQGSFLYGILSQTVLRKLGSYRCVFTGVETRPKPFQRNIHQTNNYGMMKRKQNVSTDQRIIAKAIFEMWKVDHPCVCYWLMMN